MEKQMTEEHARMKTESLQDKNTEQAREINFLK